MAENIELDAGSGGSTVAADEISGVHYPRSKIIIGADGTNDGDVSSANPLPVTGTITAVTDITNTVTVDGTVTANLSATDNAVLDTIDAVLDAINAKLVTGTVIGDVNLGATDNAVLDTIATNTTGLNGCVSGSELQVDIVSSGALDVSAATVTVDGTVTANLSATDNAVLDTIDAVLDTINAKLVTGTVIGDVNLGATDNAVLDSIATNTTGLNGCVSGSELQVDLAGGTLPDTSGGDLASMAADLGTIDTDTSLLALGIDTLGNGTYTEGLDLGMKVCAVRNDDLDALANTDNEFAPLQVDANGALYTNECSSEVSRASGVAASGTTAIVAAVAARKIRIHAVALFATSATATNVYLATTTDTDVLGNSGNPIPLAVDADGDNSAGFVLPWNPGGWTETSTANEALNLILSAAQDVIWAITYSYVP